MTTANLKESFAVESKHGAFYTGKNVMWSSDGERMFCHNTKSISVLSVSTGSITHLGQSENSDDEDFVQTFTLSNDNQHVITHHKSSLFKQWSCEGGKLIKQWKSIHNGPIPLIELFHNDLLMASGGSDSNIRLWDLEHHACTHKLKDIQGVVSVLKFHPNADKKLLLAAADDLKIHGWNAETGRVELTLTGHFSKVTSLSFHEDEVHLVSSGRDKVLILWNLSTGNSIRVLPVYESIEGTFIIPSTAKIPAERDTENSDNIYVASAGEKGVVKIWDIRSGREIYSQENSLVSAAKEEGGLSITHLLFNKKAKQFAVITVDHNILIYSLKKFLCKKQFIGYSDEILDITFVGDNDSHLAVATNSIDIKLYELETMSCQLLQGHTDLVMSLAATSANRSLLVSSAKDNSVRLWRMCSESNMMICIGSATRHTASVTSVALAQLSTKFFVSVSKDSCLKLWPLPKKISETDLDIPLNATNTVLAHENDINCITVSPNDKLLATASQDKSAKLWSSDSLQLLGVLRGHRRGVWCVRFSPIDQVLLTTSADCTIKLWSLTELNCLKTFEGHESSILKAEFISRGMQFVTSSGDGLIKLWNVKTSECVTTLDEHDSQIWGLAVYKSENKIISGGSDSSLIIWRDTTEENREKLLIEKEKLILEEQKLSNHLKANNLEAALKLALELEKPFQVLKIIDKLMLNDNESFLNIIKKLETNEKESLLKCASSWNTNSKNSHAAQLVINALLNDIANGNLNVTDLSSSLEAMIPYTERHFKRLTRLLQDLHILNYTINQIKPFKN